MSTPIETTDKAAFVARYGGLFEHSPWVAERAFAAGPFADAEHLHREMVAVVRRATRDEQTALLRAHPDLAGREAQAGAMTQDSVAEQASAGLDRLTRDEMRRIAELNAAYKAKHGFPFIIAVRNYTKDAILQEFERRLAADTAVEHTAALEQVAAIARLRLDATAAGAPSAADRRR